MRFRNLIVFVVCLALVVLAAEVWHENRELLSAQSLTLFGYAVPLGRVLGALTGAVIAAALGVLLINGVSNYLRDLGSASEHRFRESLDAKYLRGLEANLAGRHGEALRIFGEVLDLEPGHAGALLRAGESCRRLGRVEEAIAHHRRLVDHGSLSGAEHPAAALALSDDYLAAGRRSEARATLAAALLRHGADAALLRAQRRLSMEEEDWAAAIATHEKLLALRAPLPADEALLACALPYELARAERKAGKSKEAAARLLKLRKEQPAFIAGWVLAGDLAAFEQKDAAAAVDLWQDGFAATRQPVFLQRIEDLLIAGGDPEQALAVFRAAAAEFPEQLLIRFYLAKLLFRLELRQEAEREFQRLTAQLPDSPTVRYFLARLAERRGDTAGAASLYRGVIRDARALEIHYRCAHCHERQLEWADRCPACRSFASLAVEWRDPSAQRERPLERPDYLPNAS